MQARHDDPELQQMEEDPAYSGGRSVRLVREFRRVMNLIRSVPHEAELYQWKSRHFEKLKGDRKHQRSLRLFEQWRLIVEVEEQEGGNCLVVKEIVNYH